MTLTLAIGITIGAALTLLLEYLLDHRQRRHPHQVSRREYSRILKEEGLR